MMGFDQIYLEIKEEDGNPKTHLTEDRIFQGCSSFLRFLVGHPREGRFSLDNKDFE